MNMLTSHHEDRDRFIAFAFANADVLFELDSSYSIVFADGAVLGITGKRASDLVDIPFTRLIAKEDVASVLELLSGCKEGRRIERVKIRIKGDGEKVHNCVLSGYRLPTLGGHFFITISLIRNANAEMDIGSRDLSTGLLKTEIFSHKAAALIKESASSGKKLTVTLIDIAELAENSHAINGNTAYHLVDDICRYLQQVSYKSDSASQIKSGQFAVLLDDSSNPEEISENLKNIARTHLKGQKFSANANSVEPGQLNVSERDLARALQYTVNKFAESEGENFNIRSLADGYQAMLDETVQRIAAFHNTVDSGDFAVALQPIMDLRTRSVHHYEVLARIENQTAFSNPFDFISFGEKAGVITEFDLAMCQKTIDILHAAAKNGRKPAVSVNLSGQSLGSDLFKDALGEMLKINNQVKHQIIFEVTESAKIDDLKQANNFLQQLRKGGNLCCLDDFGVAESSFDYIRHLEIDYVKIDGSYVRESLETPRGKHLLHAMVALCHDMQIATIGEMVEDEKVAQFLASCGVNLGQGYYFGKPSTDIDAILKTAPNTILKSTRTHNPQYSKTARREWMNAPMA